MTRSLIKTLMLGTAGALLFLAGNAPDARFAIGLVPPAMAIVGAPLTPMSYAGVARRTTARVVAAETAAVTTTAAATTAAAAQQQQAAAAQQQAAAAQQQQKAAQQQATAAPAVGTVVTALPAGCAPMSVGGVEYHRCGSVYYRAAFQGNNLVYVTVQQP